MWVANFTDDLLGFATFPGGPAALDGYVVRTDAFGTIGTAKAPFNLGRTATHEIGHWLNLLHIWADDEKLTDICSLSDECADTPNQGVELVVWPLIALAAFVPSIVLDWPAMTARRPAPAKA